MREACSPSNRNGAAGAVDGELPHDGSHCIGTMARTVAPRSLDSISSRPPDLPQSFAHAGDADAEGHLLDALAQAGNESLTRL